MNRKPRDIALLSVLVLAACGAGDGNAGSLQGELKACELLPAADVEKLLNDKIVSSSEDVNTVNGAYAFSQCTHKVAGSGKQLTVQVARSGVPFKMSRQADADKSRAEDDGTGWPIKMAIAIEEGQDISGLGDSAYAFEFGPTHVVAYWDEHFKIAVMMSNEGLGAEKTLQVAKVAAQTVIDNLKK